MPGFRATVLETNINTLEDDPFGPITSRFLRIEGGYYALENWRPGATTLYNTSPFQMRLLKRLLDPEQNESDKFLLGATRRLAMSNVI